MSASLTEELLQAADDFAIGMALDDIARILNGGNGQAMTADEIVQAVADLKAEVAWLRLLAAAD